MEVYFGSELVKGSPVFSTDTVSRTPTLIWTHPDRCGVYSLVIATSESVPIYSLLNISLIWNHTSNPRWKPLDEGVYTMSFFSQSVWLPPDELVLQLFIARPVWRCVFVVRSPRYSPIPIRNPAPRGLHSCALEAWEAMLDPLAKEKIAQLFDKMKKSF